jgi:hypothetical protein
MIEDVFEDINTDSAWSVGDAYHHEFMSAWGFEEEAPPDHTRDPQHLRAYLAQLSIEPGSRPTRGELWITTQDYRPKWGPRFAVVGGGNSSSTRPPVDREYSCKYPKAVLVVQHDRERDSQQRADYLVDALPISFQWQYAGPDDAIIRRGPTNPLDAGLMVECDMPIAVMRRQLDRPIARLNAATVTDILLLLHNVLGLLSGNDNVTKRERLLQLDRGTLVLDDDDPRLGFKRNERQNLGYLTASARGFSEWIYEVDRTGPHVVGREPTDQKITVLLPRTEHARAAATDSGRTSPEVFEFSDGDILGTVSPKPGAVQLAFEGTNPALEGAWVLFHLADVSDASVTRSGVVLLHPGEYDVLEGRYYLSGFQVETAHTLLASVLLVEQVVPAHKPVFMKSYNATDLNNRQGWETWFGGRASEYDGNPAMREIAADILALI